MKSCAMLGATKTNVNIVDINIAENKCFLWATIHVTFTSGISDVSPYSLLQRFEFVILLSTRYV